MPNVGPLELAIVLIIALVVFGPKRLPDLGRSLGKSIREFRGSIGGDHDDEKSREIDPPPAPASEPAKAEQKAEDETVVHDRG